MVQIIYSEPMLISGVLITERILNQVAFIQTGDYLVGSKNTYPLNNDGLRTIKEEAGELTHTLLSVMTNEEPDYSLRTQIISALEKVVFLREFIESLKVPPEMVE